MKRLVASIVFVLCFSFITGTINAEYWTYGAYGDNYFEEMIPGFYPNTIYTCGTYESNVPDGDGISKNFSFYRLNHSGQVIGYNVYGYNDVDEQCNFMFKDPEENYILGGVTTNETSKDIILYKVNSSGQQLDYNRIEGDPGEDDDPAVGGTGTNGDDEFYYFVIGSRIMGGVRTIYKLTVSNELEYKDEIYFVQDWRDPVDQEAFDYAEADGNIVVVGSSDGQQYIRYCNTDLTLLDEMTMNNGKLYSIIKSSEGSTVYYACGCSDSENSSKIFLVKFQILNGVIDTLWTRTVSNEVGTFSLGNEVFQHPNGGYVYVAGAKHIISPQQKYPRYVGYSTTGELAYNTVLTNLSNSDARSVFFDGFYMATLYLAGCMGDDALLVKTILGLPDNITNPKPMSEFNDGGERMINTLGALVNYDKEIQTATVNFNITRDSECSIIMYDITGSRVQTVENCFLEQGNHMFSINTENLVPGTYFISIRTEEGCANKKFSVFE